MSNLEVDHQQFRSRAGADSEQKPDYRKSPKSVGERITVTVGAHELRAE